MTISEFLERFEAKLKEEKSETINDTYHHLRIVAKLPIGFIKHVSRVPCCPLEYVAGGLGVPNATEVLGMTLRDATQIVNAADWLRAEPQLRESLMRIMGLQEKP